MSVIGFVVLLQLLLLDVVVPSYLSVSQITDNMPFGGIMGFHLFLVICFPSFHPVTLDKDMLKSKYFSGKIKFKGKDICAAK